MKKLLILLACALQVSCMSPVFSNSFNCGSESSGIIVGSGGSLSGNVSLSNGLLRVLDKAGSDAVVTADNVLLQYRDEDSASTKLVSGTVTMADAGPSVVLADGDSYFVQAGTDDASLSITASGATATIRGEGSLKSSSNITIGYTDGGEVVNNATLKFDITSALDTGITFATPNSSVVLLNDLTINYPKLISGGGLVSTYSNKLTIGPNASPINWDGAVQFLDANIELQNDINLQAQWQIATGNINGNNRYIDFSAEGAVLAFEVEGTASLKNIELRKMSAGSINFGVGAFVKLDDVRITDSTHTQSFDVVGNSSIDSTTGDFFNSAVSWTDTTSIALNTDIAITQEWSTDTAFYLNGNGHKVDLGAANARIDIDGLSGAAYFTDILLTGMHEGSLAATGEAVTANMLNTTLMDKSGRDTVVITGSADGGNQGYATVETTGGEFFSKAVDWKNGVDMALHNRVTLDQSWTFSGDSYINGYGNSIDISSSNGKLIVAAGKKLYLSNVVIIGIEGNNATGSLQLGSDTSEVHLSNVTFVLKDATSLSVGKWFIDGTSTIITGNHKLTIDTLDGGTRLTVTACTCWYETLQFPDTSNISTITDVAGKVALTGIDGDADTKARIARVFGPNAGNIIITQDTELIETKYLFRNTAGGYGSQMVFDNIDTATNSDITLNGFGRSIIFGDTRSSETKTLLSVDQNTDVTMKNVVLDGLSSAHIALDNSDNEKPSTLTFSDHTVIKLHNNDVLDKDWSVATSAVTAPVIIDLGGNDLDLNSKKLALQADSKLIVRNGRLTGLNATGEVTFGAGAQLELEDVTLVLSGDTTFATGKLIVTGNCRIAGVANAVLTNSSTVAGALTLAAQSRLTVENSLVYRQVDNKVVFSAATAEFALEGGVLKTDLTGELNFLQLDTGRLVIDHSTQFDGNIEFGSNLTVDILPSATIEVLSGTLKN